MSQPVRRPALSIGTYLEIVVEPPERAVISVPVIASGIQLREKPLLVATAPDEPGKYTLDEHLDIQLRAGAVAPTKPLLALGMRNVLANLRAPVVADGRLYSLVNETPLLSRRPYYGIGTRAGTLHIDTALGPTDGPEVWDGFFCAGVPVLWDDMSGAQLLDLMLCEASDHSQVFDLPRGAHPLADDESRARWSELHQTFETYLHADQQSATHAIGRVLSNFDPPLRRCEDYLHAVVGIREDGALVYLVANLRLELIGQIAKQRGCRRAICIENSGSVMPSWFPMGPSGEAVALLRGPNFRPRGRALLLLELTHCQFASLSPPITMT